MSIPTIKPQPVQLPGANTEPLVQQEPAKEAQGEIIDFKAVNYTELIPIVVKAVQEMNETYSNKLNEKDKQIADLQNQVNDLKLLISNVKRTPVTATAYLKQNTPNPTGGTTTISYYVPDNSGNAQIKITDVKGSVLKVYNAAAGENQLQIKSSELPAGTYLYTLYINNARADSKKMIFTR